MVIQKNCKMKKLLSFIAIAFISGTSVAQVYYKDVAGIFYARCTSCHNQYGHAQSMLNYSQTAPWTASIQADLISGKMPAWTPDTNYTRFLHENLITSAEKTSILNWISGGALPGDTTLAPPAPNYSRYKLNGVPDAVVQIPTFTSNASSSDSYVCFALPLGLTQDRILRAYEVVAGDPTIVHHVIANIDTTGGSSNNLAGNCYTAPGQYSIGGYAPGSPPTVFPGVSPLKIGIRVKAGSQIILQIHYPKGTAGKVDSTKIRLYYYPVGTTGVRPVYVKTPLQNWSMVMPANQVTTYAAHYPSSGNVTTPLSVFATFPHSHKVCTSIINYAVSTTDTVPLIRINKWDFNQQGYYTFRYMPKITTTHKFLSSHVYDNTTNNPNNPFSPPQTIYAGTNTTDEMLFDSFEWLTYQSGDELIDVGSLLANDSLLTSVNQNTISPSIAFRVYAFPNPFQNSVRIGYVSDKPTQTSVEIYTMYGVLVKTLLNSFETGGIHEVTWDGKNNNGVSLPGGVYFYVVRTGDKQLSGKLSLLAEKD